MLTVETGRVYKHFKGNFYWVISIADHTETGEKLVIYRNLTTKETWARPYDDFISEVDHEKYPDVEQRYRFEPVGSYNMEEFGY